MGQKNRAKVVWTGEGTRFHGSVGSGYELNISGGSEDSGARPMELMLVSVAGCTAIDVVGILKKQRQDIEDVEVEIEGERAEDYPKVYTAVTVNYLVRGKGVDPQAVERAIALSEEKYCSASVILERSGAKMRTSYTIEETE